MFKKWSRSIIATVMIISLLTTMSASAFAVKDASAGHWADSALSQWKETGLLKGDSTGKLHPDRPITRAEFITLINRVFNYEAGAAVSFVDVNGSKWYASEIARAYAAGVVKGDGTGRMNPENNISRAEAAVVLAGAFSLAASSAHSYKEFADSQDVAAWAQTAVSALKENGYVQGRPGNKFAPKASITRAEAMVMINNVMGQLYNQAGSYTGSSAGNMVINTKDIVLNEAIIGGSLYLAPGIGDGDTALQSVEIAGDVFVAGGGEHSVKIKDTHIEGTLFLNRQNSNVRVVVEGQSKVPAITINNGALLINATDESIDEVRIIGPIDSNRKVIISGNIKRLIIEGPVTIELNDAVIDQLEVAENASDINLLLGDSVTVVKALLDGKAKITGDGIIKEAQVNSNGNELAKQPEKLVLMSGITVVINGKTVTEGTSVAPVSPVSPVNPGPGGPAVGSVSFYTFNDNQVPKVLKDYHLVLLGEKTLDYTITLQPSVFPVTAEGVNASVIDKAGKLWVAADGALKRLDMYETDESKVVNYEAGKYFKGNIKALLVDQNDIWILSDDSVSKIKYQ